MTKTIALLIVVSFAGVWSQVSESEHRQLLQSYEEQSKYVDELHEQLRKCVSGETNEGGNPPAETSCPSGFVEFQTHCYKFNMQRLEWDDAHDACRRQGAQLVSINSQAEQDFLVSQIQNNFGTPQSDNFWIGMHASDVSDDLYLWEDGSTVVYNNWEPGDPQCMRSGCKVMLSEYLNFTWEDATDRLPFYSICELNAAP